MLAREFIEVVGMSGLTSYVAIEHIVRMRPGIKLNTTTLVLTCRDTESSSNTLTCKHTPLEIMTLINKERELIRAMEKAANG